MSEETKSEIVESDKEAIPEDIGVVSEIPVSPTMKEISEAFSVAQAMNSLGRGLSNHLEIMAYSAIHTEASKHIKSVIKQVDDMRHFYLTEVILNQIFEDSLAPSTNSTEIFKYASENKRVQKELEQLKDDLNIDEIIEDIAHDLLAYGEYTLKNKFKNTKSETKKDELGDTSKKDIVKIKNTGGLIDIMDEVDQGSVISLTKDGKPDSYLVIDDIDGKISKVPLSEYTKFILSGTRIRIPLANTIPPKFKKDPKIRAFLADLPKFVKVGRSVIFHIMSKLKELELLEKLSPATKLNQITKSSLIGIQVPDTYGVKEGLMLAQQLESVINKKTSLDPTTKEITVAKILSSAGRAKVIPMFGDKGQLEKLDYKSEDPSDLLQSTKETREIVLDSVGVPVELVYRSEGDSKVDIIKRNARYMRKLKNLQKSIGRGCKQIAFTHLDSKGIKYKESDIEVVFTNTLPDVDNLEKLEHLDATVSVLSTLKDFFNDLSEEDSPYKDMVKLDKLAEFIDHNLTTVGLSSALDSTIEPEKDNVNVDGVDSQGNPTRQEAPVDAQDPDAGQEDQE